MYRAQAIVRIVGLNCRSHGRAQLLCCHIASQGLLQKHTVSASRGIAAAAKFNHNPAPDRRSKKLLNQTRARHTCCRQLAHVQQHDSGVDGCGARRRYFASRASQRPVGCTDRILLSYVFAATIDPQHIAAHMRLN